MAREITVRSSLSIRVPAVAFDYRSAPTQFVADLVTATPKGPTPGAITVGTSHTVIDLSQLTTPGMAWLQNQDDENFVEVGVYLSWLSLFIPVLELLPGETYPVRLARFLGEDLDPTTGTGTADSHVPQLAMKAVGGACIVRVDVFER